MPSEDEKVTFGRLDRSLVALGYTRSTYPAVYEYRHPDHRPILLRKMKKSEEVSGMSLAGVESTLSVDGVIGPGKFAELLVAGDDVPTPDASPSMPGPGEDEPSGKRARATEPPEKPDRRPVAVSSGKVARKAR